MMRRRWPLLWLVGGVFFLGVQLLIAQSTIHRTTEVWDFVNGLRVAGQTFTAVSGSSSALTFGHASATGLTLTADGGSLTVDGNAALDSIGWRPTPPAVETIAAAATITADACGTVKRITATGAVTTSLTNTFTALAAGNAGCVMAVCNVGANTITLDNNANFKSAGGLDIAVTADDCLLVGSTGAGGVWYQLTGMVAN